MMVVAVLSAGLVSCETNNAAREFQAQMQSRRPMLVRVDSDPPGATIEINNDVKGHTPCDISIPVLPNGNLLGGIEITAIPNRPGDSVQHKLLLGGRPAPKHIFFNMALGPPRPSIDVHVDTERE